MQLIVFIFVLLLSCNAFAQDKAMLVERQYLEQELLQAFRDKAKIVSNLVGLQDTLKKVCELVEEGKRPEECKK